MFKNPDLESDGSQIDFNDISLESMRMHLIFGDIEPANMKDAVTFVLKANHLYNQAVTLYINSAGGCTPSGFALIDVMDVSRLPVRTVATGQIKSMGVLIASAGTKGQRVMTRNCEVMAHQYSWGFDAVKFHELVAHRAAQDYSAHQFLQHFKRHSTMSETQIKDVMFSPSDRWLTPKECKKYGLVDTLIDELPQP